MSAIGSTDPARRGALTASSPARFMFGLVAVTAGYYLLARLGLALASINPSASPVWPASGFAVAAVLLWDYRLAPGVFVGALFANLATVGSMPIAGTIALGNTLEAVVAVYLLRRYCGGRDTFTTPIRVALFALVALFPSTMIAATVGVGALTGFAYDLPSTVWTTWWLGDAAGVLVLTPPLVLWSNTTPDALRPPAIWRTAMLCAGAA